MGDWLALECQINFHYLTNVDSELCFPKFDPMGVNVLVSDTTSASDEQALVNLVGESVAALAAQGGRVDEGERLDFECRLHAGSISR